MIKLFLIARIAFVALVLGVVFVVFNFYTVWDLARADDVHKSDAIVVLGAAQYNGKPSEVYKARLDKALALFREGEAPYIVVSGGKQDNDRVTEATAGANYLIAQGVSDSQILREVEGVDTWQELESISLILKTRNLNTVILVSDGFHLARSKAIAEHFGLEASTAVSNSPITGWASQKRMISESLALSAARVIGYARVYKVENKLNSATSRGPSMLLSRV